MKTCRTCGRERHDGLCDLAVLDNGRTVHVSRIGPDGTVDGVRVRNRWIKPDNKPQRRVRVRKN